MSHIFGPVPSRRLGRSLGVDLVPFKTCSYDCVYCQLGKTTRLTAERREWVPRRVVLEELRGKLDSAPDYITLSGSGEPTLYAGIDELVAGIREMTSVPIAVLTNGSMLWNKDVRRELAGVDLIVPSLDAGCEETWRAVNRPDPSLSSETTVEGLVAFRNESDAAYWLEVCLVEGVTSSEEEVRRIAELAKRIGPDRVQLNTATRPPAEDWAAAVPRDTLERLAIRFEPPAEVVADFEAGHEAEGFVATRDAVLQLLERRPCSVADIARGLGVHRNEAIKYVQDLLSHGRIETADRGGKAYYRLAGR